jgi:branched-subunit amino acid aminotransferase/4-amino-4-deoxychorismate lyase
MDFIINGQSADNQIIKKTYLNRGFKYGDGLFETIRRMEGRYPLLTYHQERLERGLAQIGMKVPSALSGNDWAGELDKLLPNQANARLRLTVFRAGEGAYAPTDDQSHFTLEGHPLPSARLADPTKGVRAGLIRSVEITPSPLSHLKTISALPYVLAGLEIRNRELEDGILCNSHQRWCEGGSSNLFGWTGKQYVTPPLSEGCLAGVMRTFLLKELFPSLDIPCQEVAFTEEVVSQLESIWLTNSIRGVRWIAQLEDRAFAPGPVWEVQEALAQRLAELGKCP